MKRSKMFVGRGSQHRLSSRYSSKLQRRAAAFKLESLEERTLLSGGSHPGTTVSQTVLSSLGKTTSTQQPGSSALPPGLALSVKDAHTIATVVAPTSGTSATASTSHIYTGQPTNFTQSFAASTPPSASASDPYNSNQKAALNALSKVLNAAPQYLVMPSSGIKGSLHADFEGPAGYAPAQIAGAYGISNITFQNGIHGDGAGQTIAVTDVGDYPGFVNSNSPNFDASALHIFDQEFGLPDPPNFTKYNMLGQTSPLPAQDEGWFLEIALDVEWSHAMAPDANIELVEASVSSLSDLAHASNTAATVLGASVVSQSWGLLETELGSSYEQYLENTWYVPAIAANPNVTFLAASGDGSAAGGPIFPSISPLNVSVGGTSLYVNGTTYQSESAWSDGGGGPSAVFPLPSYQQGVTAANYGPLTVRTSPDVSAVADPNTGVSVYEPELYGGWVQVGGTSVATPITSATIAIADQGRVSLGGKTLNGPEQTLPGLYAAYNSASAYTDDFNDVTTGNNGYAAGPGYDLATGIGSEKASSILPTLAVYDLGPVVTSSSPAAGSVVTTTPPTTFSLTFNEAVTPSSIVASDFTVNGIGASSFTESSNDLTITYTFNTSPVTTQGLQSLNLPAGSVSGAGGENRSDFTASFYYVQTQLQVTGTSPPVGSVLNVPDTGQTDLVVQFNKAFNPATISTSDFQLSLGTVVSAVPLTPQSVDLTLAGLNQDGPLTLTIPFGAILDQLGVPIAPFTGNYIIDLATEPYPTPLQGQNPLGSLIYDPSVSGIIGFTSNTDDFTLPVAAGQTLTLVMTPASGLTGSVTLLDPNDKVIGTATGSGPGGTVVLQTVPLTVSGTYSLVASGSGTTPGSYTLQAILNAAYKPATDSISTIGTAFNLASAFETLGTTRAADRAGVVGVLSSSPDYYAVPLTAGEFTSIAVKGNGTAASIALYNSSGTLLALPNTGSGVDGIISDFITPSTGTYYVKVTGAAGLTYDLVETRGSDFDIHGSSFNTAQPLNGAGVVLGYLAKSSAPLYTLDDQLGELGNSENPIWPTDPTTGDFSPPSIGAPGSPLNNPFGLNLAFDGTYLYYNNGASGGDNTIYKLNPTTGAVVASGIPAGAPLFTGLAYLDGNLYGIAGFNPTIYVINPKTFQITSSFPTNIANINVVGLAGDPDRDVLWAVTQPYTTDGDIDEINPNTGNVIASAPDNHVGYEQDIAYAGGQLIVSDSVSFGAGGSYLDYYNPNTLAFTQRLPVATQGYVSGLGGDGLGGLSQDWYSFNVNAGNNLVLSTTTPGATTASGLQFVNNFDPTINLYDASGNLVATATGNAADGRNSVIDYTALTAGSYRVQIVGATKSSQGEYTLSIQGATGSASPFTVTATNPAANSDIGSQISTATVTFSDSVLSSSISTSDFTIDGHNATGFTGIDGDDVSFSFPKTSDGLHKVSISGIESIQGTKLTPYSFSFTTDDVPPVVVSSSISNGAVLAPGNLTEVVTFSKPIQPSSVSTADISLLGEIRNVFYTPTSISFDPTDTILTISYSSLPTDAYQFTLIAGPANFLSLASVPLQNNYVINFTIPVGTSTLSGLQPVQPLGSLVYQSTVDNVLVSSTDKDTYDLTIDPLQTISALVTPVTSSLTLTVEVLSPKGTLLGSATSSAPGQPALVPAVQSSKGGAYEILVFGGTGEYTLEDTLNAYVDPASYGGPSNGSIATATPIGPYFNAFAGNDSRTAVLGSITGQPASFGDALVVEYNDVILINQTTGDVLERFTSPAFANLVLFDVAIAPDNTFYVLGDQNLYTGVIVHMNLAGQTLGTITSPVSDSSGYDSPEGFGLDPRDGSFWIPLVNSGKLLHLDSSGDLLSEVSIGSNPDDAAVGPDGNIYISYVFSSEIGQYNPSTGNVTKFASSPFPLDLTWSVAGDLWVGDLDDGAEEFNSSGTLIQTYDTFGASAAEPTLSGNVWDTNIDFGVVNQFNPSGDLLTQTPFSPFQPGLGVYGDVPGEAPLPPPSTSFYSFKLTQGQSATIALQSLNSLNVNFTLYNDEGDVLAVSSPGATNYTAGLNNFVAPASGTYFVQVAGDVFAQYNLVVTSGADFTTQPHNTAATAQDVTPTEFSGDNKQGGALGYISSGPSTDFYSVNAIAGNALQFATTTPAGGPNQFVNTLNPELLLYDNKGNLVAVANGNASDGRNSTINYTVPSGDTGKWTIEVTSADGSQGEYGLLVTGSTGSLSPFVVSSTTPATAALVQPPTTITVTFNDPVLITSLTPGELTVNGVSATAVSDVNANTVTWTIPSSAYATGIDLANLVKMGADSSGNQVTDVSGLTLTPYSYTFYTSNVPPTVVSSSINGQVFSPAPASVTEVVTFDQPMNTSFTTASSFELLGNYRNVQYAAASYSWDPTDTILTINYTNLPDDTYTLTLFASGFESSVGIPLASNYVANFAVANGSTALTTPLTAVPPLGDLIYTSTETHVLVTPTDVDSLTLALNAGETLTVVGTPAASAQQLVITALNPSNNTIGTATASAPGQVVTLETVPVATTGTYTIKINDAGGTIGLYTIQAYLNSYAESGTSNNSTGTAQDLTSSSFLLGSGNANRLAVVGSLPNANSQAYYSFGLTAGQSATIAVESLNNSSVQITLVNHSGTVLATGVGGSTNVSQSIENYVAPSAGTYYVAVMGAQGAQYSLVVTRGANFSIQDHNSYSTAESLTGTNGVLGYLAPPTAPFFVLDDQLGELGNAENPIWATNPTTGDFVPPAIYSPGSPLNNPFGLNLAFDGTYLYYNNGANGGDNTIYKLNPTTGAVVASGIPAGAPLFTGLAYLDGNLYGIAGFNPTIYVINPKTFQVTSSFPTNIANINVVGLAGDPDRDVLWAVTQPYTTDGDIDEINPNTGNVIASAPDNHVGYEQDIAYAGGQLIVSDSVSFGAGGSYLDYYNPNTLAFIQRLPVATEGYVSGLGGDGVGGAPKDDWYTINVQAGQSLQLQSYTPSDQGNQFPNTASLEIDVYDTFGNLVATGSKLPDGRNEALFYNAPITGQYHIEVQEDPNGQGEYYLSVKTAQYQAGAVSGEVYNDLNGTGSLAPGDPGLENWVVNVYDSKNNFIASELTDGNGNFDIGGLAPGKYKISEVLQSGWTETQPSPGTTYTVNVNPSQTTSGLNFGNFENFTISGEAFNDLTGSGSFASTDPGLEGWKIKLLNATGKVVATTTTNASGDYSFTNIGPGTYTVEEVLQKGWLQTLPASPGTYVFTAASGTNQTGLLFGNFQLVTFAGTVYNDLNGSGVLSPTDPGLKGWTVNLLNAATGSTIATTTSNSKGAYSFANLGPGQYTIDEVLQNGWYQTQPLTLSRNYSVQAISGTNSTALNFGNFKLINVTGEVYNDLNGNGKLNNGEPGLQGWTVNLLNAAGNLVATTTTDVNGDYSFDSLFPGTFTVEELLVTGWVQDQPVNPNYYQFTTQSGLNEPKLNFGNYLPVSLAGTVYNDLNGNGKLESGDPGLASWTVNVLNASGAVVATTTSGSSGSYSFTNLAPGTLTIQEIVQSGWVITQPANPPGTYTKAAVSGGSLTGLNFGNFQTITVSGNVYNDIDGNGLKGSGEPGLQGWTVNLLNSSGTLLSSITTDSNGNYSFAGISGGKYQVAEVVQTNWVQTQPLYPTVYSFTAESGNNVPALVFGDHSSPALSPYQVVDNGQSGYSETGKWSTVTGGYNGTNRVANTTSGKKATATATWTFTGVTSGKYDVYVTFAGKSGYSTAAPYAEYDGSTNLGTVDVNQSILVTQNQGLTQGSYGGVGWLDLGTVSVKSGVFSAVLSNLTSGNQVDADGVLLVADPIPAVVLNPPGSSSGGTNNAVGVGAINVTTDPQQPGGNGNNAVQVISLTGVSQAAPINVVYNLGSQPVVNQASPPQDDTVIGLGTSGRSNGGVSNATISSLAQAIVSSKKSS